MIPKKIHYCWFGGNNIPDNLQKCIDSWKKIMPDYEIIKWDESNYDVTKCDYIKEAYDSKKWAFVSDFARLDILYNNGGIYLDVDVEVYKTFDDLLHLEAFCGREVGHHDTDCYVNTGLVMGMSKGNQIGKILRDDYLDKHFVIGKDKLDLTPCPVIQTNKLKEMGLTDDNCIQDINGLVVFPTEYFCPMNQYTGEILITNNTYSIHHYFGSWYSQVDQKRRALRMKYSNYGNLLANIISAFIAYREEYGLVKMWNKILEKLIKR